MSVLEIVKNEDVRLRQKSMPITHYDEKLGELLDNMRDTMRKNNGCGIAAVQVGAMVRAFIVEAEGMYIECVNPTMLSQSGSSVMMEGCLSFPNKSGYVQRPTSVKISAFTREGTLFKLEAKDFLARAICHEYDHLEGIVYIDKLCDKNGRKL